MDKKDIIAILKQESQRITAESKAAVEIYNQNRRKLKNRIAYEQLLAQGTELNRICIALNISLVNDNGDLISS